MKRKVDIFTDKSVEPDSCFELNNRVSLHHTVCRQVRIIRYSHNWIEMQISSVGRVLIAVAQKSHSCVKMLRIVVGKASEKENRGLESCRMAVDWPAASAVEHEV